MVVVKMSRKALSEETLSICYVIRPLYYLSKCLGLAPFVLIVKDGVSQYKCSWKASVYSALFYLGCVALHAALLQIMLGISLQGLARYAVRVFVIGVSVTHLSTYLVLYFNRWNTILMFEKIQIVDELLNISQTSFSNAYKKMLKQVRVLSISYGVGSCACVYMSKDVRIGDWTFASIVNFFLFFSTSVMEVQFLDLVWLLKQRFTVVNEYLRAPDATDLGLLSFVDFESNPKKHEPSHNTNRPMKVAVLALAHSYLRDIAKRVDGIYSFHSLMTIATTFGGILYTVFFILLMSFQQDTGEFSGLSWAILMPVWTVALAVLILTKAHVCNEACLQVKVYYIVNYTVYGLSVLTNNVHRPIFSAL